MAKLKIYAVARGREVGLFTNWAGPNGAQAQIEGFSKALYKSFEGPDARGVALRWLVSTGVELPLELATEAALLIGGQLTEAPPPAETAAPASTARAAVCPLIPPSTSSSMGRPDRSISART